jgi:hypothetical protein
MTLPQVLHALDNHSVNGKLAPDARRVLGAQAITLRAINQRASGDPAKDDRLQRAIAHAEFLISAWT